MIRVARISLTASSLEYELQELMKKSKGVLISVFRDGPGYAVVLETKFKGPL